ncbi:hypothetical protein [Corynebacterium marquesiae]|uniref:hypothetical protein n=1 Tax=Corynebacterium marquesiae TaxID=2913503 RepID=UPI0022BA1911|nr:hypothetical protein [Corynebacterium marquesiae]MCZ9301660.1 hypothetical protein [Corynebacterium marquesiae]
MSDFFSDRSLDVSGTRVLFGIGAALSGSLLLSIWCEGGSEGWWAVATGVVLIAFAVVLLCWAALRKSWRRQALWGLLFVVYGILGALLVPFGITRFFTACVWVGVMSNVWVTLPQSVRI